ncbi:hypothetical protein [Nonomuraea cavernae]|uniref:Ferric oxidoreductase domain-containing protein n=1 Tax=Nonomuraea cavernae TaxID=2045107 RepID=A0A918DNZ9_9ACTN|nr:hypothetical protein [Nonomuraea cavernae]MCA2185792.1 hypothetical protein [Nonomuraea cavernae]GGO75624.1 hypothetical protein GCM10012289_51100 [Nonomuraea cavernae]
MLHRRHPLHAPTKLDRRNVRLGVSASIAALLLSAFALTLTNSGMSLLGRGVGFLEFYAGVFALVLLTATVALGLLTTEKVFLSPANRVRAQLAHRATAAIGLAYLVTHVTLMISLGHVPPAAAVLPVAGIWIGFGTLAADMMVLIIITGVVRGRFAVTGRPWVWRILHAGSYLAWPVAILHGLTAGRPAAGWVTWSYVACLVAVGSALLVRVLATLRRPPAMPEPVDLLEVDDSPIERPEEINAPVSLDAARRKFREAG